MNSRQVRNRTNRRLLLLGGVVSVGLHVWLLSTLTIDPLDLSRAAGEPQEVVEPADAEVTELKLLQVEVVESEVEPPPLPTDERPLLADAAPAPQPEPEAATHVPASPAPAPSASAAALASAAAGSAPERTLAEILEAGLKTRTELAVAPRLPGQRAIDGWSPVEAIDPHAGHDHAEDDGSNGNSFWRRLGRTFGIGGDQICRIIPKDAGKVDGR